MKNCTKILNLITLTLVLLYSTVAIAQDRIQWVPLFKGIQAAHVEWSDPLMKISLLRINTNVGGIEFHTTGRHPEYADTTSETDRRTTVDFLKENNLSVAINGSFYTPFNQSTTVSRGPSNITGLAIADGVVVSRPENNFPSFIITKKGKFEIRQVAPDESLDEIQLAVSGSAIVLKDGKVVTNADTSVHPRTAIGISRGARYIYFMTIDGRQNGYSIGATLEQVGFLLKKVGAAEGINLDGGGSTTMVYMTPQGEPALLNRPVGLGSPYSLRHNGNSIGVKAKNLPLSL
ncbi:MAG: phosphodiester glycosidase family protein [Planctomycetia bacterium]|nr:phosphodiester glycosidase family protein [Planctomycetia bacterium]